MIKESGLKSKQQARRLAGEGARPYQEVRRYWADMVWFAATFEKV
jgi:hypothetical protein